MTLLEAEDMMKEDKETAELLKQVLSQEMSNVFASTDPATEKQMFKALCNLLYSIPVEEGRPAGMTYLFEDKYKGNIDKLVDDAFSKSVFANEKNFNKFISNPKTKKLEKDLIAHVAIMTYQMLVSTTEEASAAEAKLEDVKALFIEALRAMDPSLVQYPDANFTMRVTYGQVLDYYPADAVHYDYVTTIDGLMEKEDPTNDEFIVPSKLKELYNNKDYGQYADKDGRLITCFLSNNDITGGNSGSPILNADGHLIGLAFDGNWEAMSGDIAFEPELQRTINVDARYVLFIIDKYAGAKNLIDELTIIK